MFKDMSDVMKKAQQMQQKMQQAQDALKAESTTGISGAGLVAVNMNGTYEAKSVTIDDSAMDDKEMLEDLITAAINDANKKIQAKNTKSMQNLTGGILPNDFKMPF